MEEQIGKPHLISTLGNNNVYIWLGKFPNIDAYHIVTKKAIQIKSLDLNAPTYQTLKGIKGTVRRDRKKTLAFTDGGDLDQNGDFTDLVVEDVESFEILYIFPDQPRQEIRDWLAAESGKDNLTIRYIVGE